VLPLEMIGVLLTSALLGAVVIAMREEPEVKTKVAGPTTPTLERQEELAPR
jgi:hypothetical protein